MEEEVLGGRLPVVHCLRYAVDGVVQKGRCQIEKDEANHFVMLNGERMVESRYQCNGGYVFFVILMRLITSAEAILSSMD